MTVYDDNYYDNLISKKVNTSKIIDMLYKIPIKDTKKNKTHFYSYSKPNIVHQADLLYLPEDNGKKYALVIVDLHKRITDAVPLSTKKPEEVLEGFKTIYSGKYLKLPKKILLDAGSEFKSVVAEYFKNNKVAIKIALADRHRQQGIVEQKNLIIGRALLKKQTEQEINTGQIVKNWVADLPHIIAAINRKAKDIPEKNIGDEPVCTGNSCELLNIGDMVRIALDAPRSSDSSDKKLSGKFRASDIRWTITPVPITNIDLQGGMPPLYQVAGKPSVRYTKNQLQLVTSNVETLYKVELYPNPNPNPR